MSLVLFVVAVLFAPAGQPRLQVLSNRVLSGDAARALDVRWISDDAVYVTTYDHGILQVDAAGHTSRVPFSPTGTKCPSCSRLAISKDYIATAFPVYHLAWKNKRQAQLHELMFDAIIDIDLKDDRLLLLGSRREGKEWAPDGAVAWTGTLSRDLTDLRPVLYSTAGPEAMTVARCGFLEPGAARFFDDGSFVVVPGVEPDVYLYDRAGALLHTWQTAKLGFVDHCDLSQSQIELLSGNPRARYEWMSRHTILQDVLPLWEGPALLLQQVHSGVSRWTMLILSKTAGPRRVELPFSAPFDLVTLSVSSLRADVRGKHIAFLVRMLGPPQEGVPELAARLIIAEWQ